MKKTSLFFMAVFAALIFTACGGNSEKKTGENAETPEAVDKHYAVGDLVDIDLSAQGIPATVKAPKDAQITKSGDGKEVYIVAGKYFKMTAKANEGTSTDFLEMVKPMASDKELNPSFEKFEEDMPTGFLKKNTDGKMSFVYLVDGADGNSVLFSQGIPYDVNTDGFTDYSAEDVKTMWEGAKGAKAK